MSTCFITASDVPSPPPHSECRVYERHPLTLSTACQPACSGELKWTAVIRNVSRGGICLSLRRRFERGTGLSIELPDRDGKETYAAFVKVVYTTAEEGGTWALGCKFVSELSEDELQRLVLAARPQPRRKPLSDVAPPPEKQLFPDVRLQIDLPRGRSIRRRVQRLLVASTWPYAPGTTLTLRVGATNGSRTPHRFEVVSCSNQGDDWALRVRLLDPSAEGELLRAVGR